MPDDIAAAKLAAGLRPEVYAVEIITPIEVPRIMGTGRSSSYRLVGNAENPATAEGGDLSGGRGWFRARSRSSGFVIPSIAGFQL